MWIGISFIVGWFIINLIFGNKDPMELSATAPMFLLIFSLIRAVFILIKNKSPSGFKFFGVMVLFILLMAVFVTQLPIDDNLIRAIAGIIIAAAITFLICFIIYRIFIKIKNPDNNNVKKENESADSLLISFAEHYDDGKIFPSDPDAKELSEKRYPITDSRNLQRWKCPSCNADNYNASYICKICSKKYT